MFHPLLMATYLYSLLLFTVPFALAPVNEAQGGRFILIIFCVTFALPALNIGLFRLFGTVKSLTMRNRNERVIPFTFIAILYCAITYLFFSGARMSADDNVIRFLLIIDLLVITAAIITFFYKISVHSLAMGGLLGILLPLNQAADSGVLFYPLLGVIGLTGVVMAARLYLNAHTLSEVLSGAVVGVGVSFLALGILF